jgi:hypothetical protein
MSTPYSRDDPRLLLALIKGLHETIRRIGLEACERSAMETLGAVARDEGGDSISAL